MIRHRLSRKLSASFGALFATIILVTGILVYSAVQREVTDTLQRNLDTTSDLIKRIVEINTENNWDQVAKNLALAREISRGIVYRNDDVQYQLRTFDDIREETRTITLSALVMDGETIGPDSALVGRIHAQTGGVVSIYALTSEGYVCVSSSRHGPPEDRGVGYRIPEYSSFHTLITRGDPYIGRDYFGGYWYLTAYQPLRQGSDIVGALHVAVKQVNMERLSSDINSIVIGNDGYSYIIDVGSNIVLHPLLSHQNLSIWPYIREITFSRNGHIRYFAEHEPEPHYFVATYKYIPAMNWIVVVGSSEGDFFDILWVLRSLMLAVFGIALVGSLTISFLIGRQITKPVTLITNKIKEISEGAADLNHHLEIQSNDELGELSIHFNTFISKLRTLKEVETREAELQLRDAQMNALQAQINPHFLYNTLETIRFLITTGNPDAVLMVQYLADLLRVSIGKRERYARLKNEIEHIQLYLEIQRMRYPDKFQANIDIPDDLQQLFVVKFMLQPLIENAINHGFDQVETGGKILVRARIHANELEVIVEDNGGGIESTHLRRIQDHLDGPGGPGGIGIHNVHERLRLLFGDRATFKMSSALGQGTTVAICLPVLYHEPASVNGTTMVATGNG